MPVIKFDLQGDVRRVVLPEWPDLQSIHAHLAALPEAEVPSSYVFKYFDSDGDKVSIRSDADLDDMIATCGGNGTITLLVTENARPPGSALRTASPVPGSPASSSSSSSSFTSPNSPSLSPARLPPGSAPARSGSTGQIRPTPPPPRGGALPRGFPLGAQRMASSPQLPPSQFSSPPRGRGVPTRALPPAPLQSVVPAGYGDVPSAHPTPLSSVVPAGYDDGPRAYPSALSSVVPADPSEVGDGEYCYEVAAPMFSFLAQGAFPSAESLGFNHCAACFGRPQPDSVYCVLCGVPLTRYTPRSLLSSESSSKSVLHFFERDLDIGSGFSQVLLGTGSYGRVVKGKMTQTGIPVAVKLFNFKTREEMLEKTQEINQEAEVMSRLDHPNLVNFIGYMVHPQIALVLELMEGGDLFSYLHVPVRGALRPLGPDVQFTFMTEIASGLAYLHASNMAHRDLKSSNVLLDTQHRCKLADFGFAKKADSQQMSSAAPPASKTIGHIGTENYNAPEVMDHHPYTQAGDLYALGVLFWEIASRAVPWEQLSPFEIRETVLIRRERLPGIASLPPMFAGMVEQLTSWEPSCRPSIEVILAVLLPKCPAIFDREHGRVKEEASKGQIELRLEVERLRMENEKERLELQRKKLEKKQRKLDKPASSSAILTAEDLDQLALRQARLEATRRAEEDAARAARAAADQEEARLAGIRREAQRKKDAAAQVIADREAKDPRGFFKLISTSTEKTLDFSCKQIGEAESTVFAEALLSNLYVVTLNLAGNQISDDGTLGLATFLKQSSSITELDLHDNLVRNQGCEALASALKTNSSLISLNLRGNRIGPEGARAIADALKINTTLATLSLSSNRIKSEGSRAVAEALKVNTTLVSLNLGDNHMGDDGCKAVCDALKINTKLTSLNLWGNPLGFMAKRKLKKRFGTRGSLYV